MVGSMHVSMCGCSRSPTTHLNWHVRMNIRHYTQFGRVESIGNDNTCGGTCMRDTDVRHQKKMRQCCNFVKDMCRNNVGHSALSQPVFEGMLQNNISTSNYCHHEGNERHRCMKRVCLQCGRIAGTRLTQRNPHKLGITCQYNNAQCDHQ